MLNGPTYAFPPNNGLLPLNLTKTGLGQFTHPGIWHTHSDLECIRRNALSTQEPYASVFAAFANDSFSQSTYEIQGPNPVLSRGLISNYSSFTNDVRAAWQNSLMWFITNNTAHKTLATTILDAWGSNLTNIIGTDASLLVGLEGTLFVNAAEIMRWEAGWVEAGSSWAGGNGFSVQLYWLFARQSVIIGQANYGMISIQALLAFAVYLDDVVLWNYAMNEYVNGLCAGLPGMFQPGTGQSSETGRDQGHVQSGLGWTAYGARVARSQGAELYGLQDNLLLTGAEYTAKFNLNGSVPFDPSFYRCEAVLVGGPWKEPSTQNFGIGQAAVWDIFYWEYVVRRGLKADWVVKAREAYGMEGHQTTSDQPGWGDLIWSC